MSRARHYAGLTASQGSSAGLIYQADTAVSSGTATPDEVEAAFAAVAAERQALAGRLREAGRTDEADIVAVAALIAADPVLAGAAVAAVRNGADATTAIQQAAASQAAVIAAIRDPALAERASDVRQVAVAVLEYLAGDRPA